MKNMKKVLAVMTAVSAMAASTSAFAAIDVAFDVENFSATYDVETNKFAVTLTDYTAAEDMTLLILDKDVADEANVQDGEIRYIDQGKAFVNAGLKLDELATQLAPGSYPVKLGYDDGDSFEIAEATLIIEAADEGTTISVKWGDVTRDGALTGADAIAVGAGIVGNYGTYPSDTAEDATTVGTTYGDIKWGDITCDSALTGADAIAIGAGIVGNYGTYTLGEKTYTVGTNYDIKLD